MKYILALPMNGNDQQVSRAACIVIKKQSILLMYRKKHVHKYYVFPGGSVEPHEKNEDAALRELYEETSVQAEVVRLLYKLTVVDNSTQKEEFFFLCNFLSGKPSLAKDSVELQRMAPGDNFYKPLWVDINAIKELTLYPPEIKNLLVHDLKEGFSDSVKNSIARRPLNK